MKTKDNTVANQLDPKDREIRDLINCIKRLQGVIMEKDQMIEFLREEKDFWLGQSKFYGKMFLKYTENGLINVKPKPKEPCRILQFVPKSSN